MIYLLFAYMTYPFVFILSRLCGGRGKRRERDSILVFQTAKIGDMICATPVFREIKRVHPSWRLGVAIDWVSEPVIRHNPHIDEIIIIDRKKTKGLMGKLMLARSLRKKDYSAALILLPNATNILAAFWAMIPERVSVYPDYLGRTLKELLTFNTALVYHLYPKTALETYLEALRPFGIAKCENTAKEVYPPPGAAARFAGFFRDADEPFVGIALSTGNAMKDWGRKNFAELAREVIASTDAAIVLFGTERDAPLAIEIAGSINKNRRVENLCGGASLEELPALIKGLSLMIGVDTGLIYMADALGVPVIDIAGPCNMIDQRPTGGKAQIIQRNDVGCIPCSHTFRAPYECRYGDRRCVAGITVDDVMKRVFNVIPGRDAA
ncbi:MAG: glycosyltransferase family 9 protein [Deltaproteobacteria bacterium]|nr:glycosyltransferase family 9 protein [Deltaproteobacteria bacterium]